MSRTHRLTALLIVCLAAQPLAAADLVSHSRKGNLILLELTQGSAQLEWISASTFRFSRSWTKPDAVLPAAPEREAVPLTVHDSGESLELRTEELVLQIHKAGLKLEVLTAAGMTLLSDLAGAGFDGAAVRVERKIWPGERFYGLGLRDDVRIDARGATITTAKPFLISTRGYGLHHASPGTYSFDLGETDPQRYRISVQGAARLEFYFYYGLTTKQVFEQHFTATGAVARLRPEQVVVLPAVALPADSTRLPRPRAASWRALQELIRTLIHGGLSAVLLPALDLAPYRSADEAVYRRMSQLAAVIPLLFDSHPAGPVLHPEGRELRRQLTPYLLTYAQEAHDRGFPVIHPLPMQFPSDPEGAKHGDEFLFGDEILVAPITSMSNKRLVYFPMGAWTSLRTNQIYRGKQTVEIAAGDDELPMFVKTGSILPLAPEKPGAPMTAHYFPPLAAEFFLSEDDLWSPTQLHAAPAGDYLRLETESKKGRDYEWVVHHTGEPREIAEGPVLYQKVAGRDALAPGRWFYDGARRSLHVLLRASAGQDHIINIAF